MHTTTEKPVSTHNVAMVDVTYLGQIEQLVGGQPYSTVGYTMMNNERLQYSNFRSDGKLLALREATATWSAPRFTSFEFTGTSPALGVNPLPELLPALLVAAQTEDGELALYERARREHPDHPYHDFLEGFTDSIVKSDSASPNPGAYLQVLPYLGDGPVDVVVKERTADLDKFISQPFWLHFMGAKRHVVIGEDFIVLPKRPVLVSVGEKRYVFSIYIYK